MKTIKYILWLISYTIVSMILEYLLNVNGLQFMVIAISNVIFVAILLNIIRKNTEKF